VVDASARGDLSPGLLRATGWPDLQTTRIGIDITYMTATFPIAGGERDWKLAITYPDRQEDTRIAIVVPIEGQRWMVAVGERYGTIPPADEASFRECLRQLRTSTIHDAIRSAPLVGGVHRFALPESSRRHYERLPGLPDGLLPIGDAICRFNPIYGQGMSVAGIEACILKDLLRARRGGRRPLAGLGQAYIEAVQPVVDAAWSMSAVPDLAHPLARGERPGDLEQQLQATMALFRLATRDPEAHRLMVEVRHMLQPLSALRAPGLQRRLELEIAA
jgi:2-polyprenyl-6-methoxyphenol hydroxylase-like FAD-dependent oxidoreductase